MLAIGSTVVGVDDIGRAVEFWTSALGYVRRDAGDGDETFVVLVPGDGSGVPRLSLMLSRTPVQEAPRVHLDLYADGEEGQRREVERLLALGARRVDWDRYPPGADFVVLEDPDGNRFCVIAYG